jgi:hypothetical protein
MTRIGSSHDPASLAALIRSQIAALNKESSVKTKATDMASAASSGESADSSTGAQSAMVQGIRALRPDDPQRKRKAFGIFMGAVLNQRLGLPDEGPYVDQLVQQVIEAMNADPKLAKDMDDAAALLLGGGMPHLSVP